MNSDKNWILPHKNVKILTKKRALGVSSMEIKKPKIVIAGTSKSGTTALYFKIKNSMPRFARGTFEIRRYEPRFFDNIFGVVAKIFCHYKKEDLDTYKDFDKKILLVRDPRDIAISTLLYGGGFEWIYNKDKERILEWINLIMEKEKNPSSVSVKNLGEYLLNNEGVNPFFKHFERMIKETVNFRERYKDYFMLKYEDLIRGEISSLEDYLGFKLVEHNTVGNKFSRVVRTKGSDNWRNWFTEEDIAFFKSLLTEYLEKFEYNAADWKLNENPKILPEHASGYVLRILNERREGDKLEKISI